MASIIYITGEVRWVFHWRDSNVLWFKNFFSDGKEKIKPLRASLVVGEFLNLAFQEPDPNHFLLKKNSHPCLRKYFLIFEAVDNERLHQFHLKTILSMVAIYTSSPSSPNKIKLMSFVISWELVSQMRRANFFPSS